MQRHSQTSGAKRYVALLCKLEDTTGTSENCLKRTPNAAVLLQNNTRPGRNVITKKIFKKLLYGKSDHWLIQPSIVYATETLQCSGLFQSYLEISRLEFGTFYVHGLCSTMELQLPNPVNHHTWQAILRAVPGRAICGVLKVKRLQKGSLPHKMGPFPK